MKKFENKEDLELCIKSLLKIDYYNYNLQDFFNDIPEDYKNNFVDEMSVYPRHLTTDFFKQLFIDFLFLHNKNFILDNNSKKIIDEISQYATRDEKFLINDLMSFDKGILLMGKVGCGKTLIFQGLISLLKIFAGCIKIQSKATKLDSIFIPAYSLVEIFSIKGYEMFGNELYHNENKIKLMAERIFIDDIGSENIVSNFGNTTNVVGELILRRYDKGKKTFATTNLDPKTLKSFYGDRVYSRLNEMCNFIVVDGNDRRL